MKNGQSYNKHLEAAVLWLLQVKHCGYRNLPTPEVIADLDYDKVHRVMTEYLAGRAWLEQAGRRIADLGF